MTIFLLIFCYSVYGQDSLNYQGQPIVIRDLPSKIKKAKPPLFIISLEGKTCQVPSSVQFSNSRQVKKTFKKFNADWIESIDVLKEKNATDMYGTRGQYGVIIINLKTGTFDKLPKKLKRACEQLQSEKVSAT